MLKSIPASTQGETPKNSGHVDDANVVVALCGLREELQGAVGGSVIH